MNKNTWIVIAVLVVLAGGAGVYALTASSSDSKSSDTSSASSEMNMDKKVADTDKSADNPESAVATNAVSIEGFAYTPANITVKKGTTVTWTNNDTAAHTVTSNDDSTAGGLDSKGLEKGETYSATFNTVGTFTYHCTFHSNMTGSVTVTE